MESTASIKDGDWYIYLIILSARKILKPLIKTHRKGLQTSNLAYTILLVQGKWRKNMAFYVYLLAVVGSQGIVVNVQPPSFSVQRIENCENRKREA